MDLGLLLSAEKIKKHIRTEKAGTEQPFSNLKRTERMKMQT